MLGGCRFKSGESVTDRCKQPLEPTRRRRFKEHNEKDKLCSVYNVSQPPGSQQILLKRLGRLDQLMRGSKRRRHGLAQVHALCRTPNLRGFPFLQQWNHGHSELLGWSEELWREQTPTARTRKIMPCVRLQCKWIPLVCRKTCHWGQMVALTENEDRMHRYVLVLYRPQLLYSASPICSLPFFDCYPTFLTSLGIISGFLTDPCDCSFWTKFCRLLWNVSWRMAQSEGNMVFEATSCCKTMVAVFLVELYSACAIPHFHHQKMRPIKCFNAVPGTGTTF